MRLAPEDINAWRALVQWAVRGLAALCLAAGAYLLLKRLLFAVGTGEFYLAFRSWGNDLGESASLYRSLALLMVGTALALGARRLSRWIVVLPSTGCPGCGHLRPPGGQDSRCPECGLEWPRR